MSHRDPVDAVVFIVLGTFIATYALVLVSSQYPDHRLKWLSGRDMITSRDPVFNTLTFVGIFSAVWGGTGLQHLISIWLAVLIALGPLLILRGAILIAHNRRLARTLDAPPGSS